MSDMRKVIEAATLKLQERKLTEISLNPGDDASESADNVSMLLEEAKTQLEQLIKYIAATDDQGDPELKRTARQFRSTADRLLSDVRKSALAASGLSNDIRELMGY